MEELGMFDKVRAKFTVAEVTKLSPTYGKVKLTPQYDNTIPEDVRFAKATPSGSLEMYIDNPPAFEFFEIGKAFYLDFARADQ
jgi:hypothetical protein